MKKQYQKPTMELEDFRLDVEIASRNPTYDAMLQIFFNEMGRVPNSDEEFQQFIRDHSGLDANDGWCYFTAYIPS